MLKHKSDISEEEKKQIDKLLDDINDGDNEQLSDEFDEEEGCVLPDSK